MSATNGKFAGRVTALMLALKAGHGDAAARAQLQQQFRANHNGMTVKQVIAARRAGIAPQPQAQPASFNPALRDIALRRLATVAAPVTQVAQPVMATPPTYETEWDRLNQAAPGS